MRLTLALLLTVLLLPIAPAVAQPIETVLIDDLIVLYPGETQSRCINVERGVLNLTASSPPGRTGEDARLGFRPNRQTTHPEVFLSAILTMDALQASHTVESGGYCYWVSVTQRIPDAGDPNRPERPSKQVRVRVTHEAYP